MTSPRITVLMPVWNGARFLDEAIESVISQDYLDFELLIVDDSSTDETPRILASWASSDHRIVLLRNDRNLGVTATLNHGLRAARGVYVARQDSDDISMPGRLAAQIAALDADERTAMVSMNFNFIDEHGALLRTERRDQPPEIVDFVLNFTNAIGGHSQVMFRRDLVLELGGYDESWSRGQDYELWTRIARRGRIVILPRIGMGYRIHGDQVSAQERGEDARERALTLSRGLLNRWFGRELTDEEVLAATSAWRGVGRGADAERADGLLREAVAIFVARYPDRPALLERLREVTARRLAATATILLHRLELREGLRFFMAALRWSIPGALGEPPRMVCATMLSRWRRKSPAVRTRQRR